MSSSVTESQSKQTWYSSDIGQHILESTRQMLKEYSGIPYDQTEKHIEETLERAWAVAPYPSVGKLTWVNPYISIHLAHSQILAKVKAGGRIIDCGCMFAMDLRQLAYEGAPTENMYGFDLENRFLDMSYDYYNDHDTFRATFFKASVFDTEVAKELTKLNGTLDVVWAAKIVHLFNRETQIKVIARLIKLLKPEKGVIFAGSQNGHPQPREMPVKDVKVTKDIKLGQADTIYMGNAESYTELWKEVEELTGTKWNFQARLLDLRTVGYHNDDGTEISELISYNLQYSAVLLEP